VLSGKSWSSSNLHDADPLIGVLSDRVLITGAVRPAESEAIPRLRYPPTLRTEEPMYRVGGRVAAPEPVAARLTTGG
jgi:hypothetical protein